MNTTATAPRTGYRISRDARTMARFHGFTTSAVVAIARDLNLNARLEDNGTGRTRWTIDEPVAVLTTLADHLETLTA